MDSPPHATGNWHGAGSAQQNKLPDEGQVVNEPFAYGLWGLVIINSLVFIVFALMLLAAAWKVFWQAQREHQLATTGLYARIRHPQYVGFVAILLGFLLQWPTLLTLAMFPVLVGMYAWLARREEAEMEAEFGDAWLCYAARTPRFIPKFGAKPPASSHSSG